MCGEEKWEGSRARAEPLNLTCFRLPHRWWAEYVHFEPDKQWAYHSVLLPRQLHAKHPGEVLVLSDKAFFYPLWTQLSAMYDRDDG